MFSFPFLSFFLQVARQKLINSSIRAALWINALIKLFVPIYKRVKPLTYHVMDGPPWN